MKKTVKATIILIVIGIFVITIIGFVLLRKSEPVRNKVESLLCKVPPAGYFPPPAPPQRTVHFPENQSVGLLYTIAGDAHYVVGIFSTSWDFFGEACGNIDIPNNVGLRLEVNMSPIDMSFLSKFKPDDLQCIDFSAPIDKPFELYVPNQTKRIVPLEDDQLKHLSSLTGLYQLILHNTTITDVGLARLQGLKSLRSINLFNTKITDEGLKYLGKITSLQEIYLGATNITDNGLEHLTTLSQLRVLSLTGSRRTKGNQHADACSSNYKITDEAVKTIKSFKLLQVLDLADTNISDSSIPTLGEFKHLFRLNLSGTLVTDSGTKRLQKALPKCQIVHDRGLR